MHFVGNRQRDCPHSKQRESKYLLKINRKEKEKKTLEHLDISSSALPMALQVQCLEDKRAETRNRD